MEPRNGRSISWRTVAFAASLLAVAGGGYAFTASASAEHSRSQDPRAWDDGNGRVDESKVPGRVAMSTSDIDSGVVYIDPHKFYGQLGATSDEGPVEVYSQRDGGDAVGTYDLRTGEITIDLEYSRHTSRPDAVSRTRTTVAAPTSDPVDSAPPTSDTVAPDTSGPASVQP